MEFVSEALVEMIDEYRNRPGSEKLDSLVEYRFFDESLMLFEMLSLYRKRR